MNQPEIFQQIEHDLVQNDVVLYMKGTKMFPQCGFSASVVEILLQWKVDFQDINVLTNPQLRQGIKEYAQWPTIPQLYIKKQFVGGCDILIQLHQNHQIQQLFEEHNISFEKPQQQ